ncbi:MAG: endonuclease, partial [Gracilimonas sp.]|nr:endonuclease [Gracilimonas sp.]
SANIDLYSESTSSAFEPREDFKGNVARAIFYFWTIYQDNSSVSGSGNESFFTGMKETLYDWHKMDPVDQEEVDRSMAVEAVQGNRNPFIHDTSLVRRSYFYSGGDDGGNNGGDPGSGGDETTETFSGIPDTGSSYGTVSWTGDNGLTWTATDARTDQTINGKAITVRDGALTSPEIAGGIQSLTLTTQRKFSGTNGELKVIVNDTLLATISYSESESTSTLSDLNVAGNFVLKIETPGNGDRVAMDDLSWVPADTAEPVLSTSVVALDGFSYSGSGPSAEQTFTVSGSDLSDDISVSVPDNFEISEEGGAFEAAVSPITFTPTDGSVSGELVRVRLKEGLSTGLYNETISITSGSAVEVTVSLSGEVSGEGGGTFSNTEGFDNFPETGSSYENGSFAGVQGNTWNYVEARGDQQIDGPAPGLARDANASLSTTLSGGISGFSFDYKQLFSTDVELEVYINDELVTTVQSNNETGVLKNSGEVAVSVEGSFSIRFQQSSDGGQVAVDNFSWNAPVDDDLGTVDLLLPANNDWVGIDNPYFEWTSSEEAESYTFNLSESETFTDLVFDSTLTAPDTSFTLPFTLQADKQYYWRVQAENSNGTSDWSEVYSFVGNGGLSIENNNFPNDLNLRQNYPNPFNPTTNISYGIPEASEVRLEIFNMLGQQVATLVEERKSAGWHVVTFDAGSLSSGLYIYRLSAGHFSETKQMILIK